MRGWPEPGVEDLLRTVEVARLLLGPAMNIQAPPNLSAAGYERLAAAGLNDWGGVRGSNAARPGPPRRSAELAPTPPMRRSGW